MKDLTQNGKIAVSRKILFTTKTKDRMPEVPNLPSPSWTYPSVKEVLKALFNPAGFFGAVLLHDLQTLELKNQRIYEFTKLFEKLKY